MERTGKVVVYLYQFYIGDAKKKKERTVAAAVINILN